MKKVFFSLIISWVCSVAAIAAPAYPKPYKVTNPDGTQITIVGHGNEYRHYTTTTDGYTIMKGADGYYYYAQERSGKSVASRVKATDVDNRVASETRFLSSVKKGLMPEVSATATKIQRQQLQMKQRPMKVARQMTAGSKYNAPIATENSYRGLVILVNFNDRKFNMSNEEAHSFYTDMMNQQGYTGYDDKNIGWQACTGSVRDYFADNSYGQFTPEFDVVGPIDVDCSQYYINGVDNTYELVENVLRTADPQVDYSRYDADGDGEVDMFYIIYAGYSSSYEGNDERLMWPHAASMVDPDDDSVNVRLDGKLLGRFACSAEFYGWERDNQNMPDGIGVICHEFSHVLGFEDHYDTLGSQQEEPNSWDIMSAGSYNGEYNRTPCGYNAYEKYSAGFLQPTLLNEMPGSSFTMNSLETSKDAYIIRSNQEGVSFIIENRQYDKWDKGLLGHGMLVWFVDSTDTRYWDNNVVNTYMRPCFRLVRATGTQGSYFLGVIDGDFDPFPGSGNVHELTNETTQSNLLTWDRIASPVVLKDIQESNGVISLLVEADEKSDDQPVSYHLSDKYTVRAEQFIDDEWKPVSWTMRTGKITSKSGDELDAFFNFLPNTENLESNTGDGSNELTMVYSVYDGGRTIKMEAQRMFLGNEYGIWLCNFTNVESGSTGKFNIEVSRHGVPALINEGDEIGYCMMQPSAYFVNNKKMISQLNKFRNIVFQEFDENATAVTEVEADSHVVSGIYNLQGQKISLEKAKNDKGIYIINGKKIAIK